MQPWQNIGVIGAGAWGVALALTLARAGRSVQLYGRRTIDPSTQQILAQQPIHVCNDMAAMRDAAAWVLAIPTQNLRSFWQSIDTVSLSGQPLLIAAKGLEATTDLLPQQIFAAIAPAHPVALISGPNFASEITLNLPTATTIAAADETIGHNWVRALGHDRFRPYYSADPIGVGMGGALKNVLAIASGIVIGMGLGENARASVVTRGLVEMTRLSAAVGGQAATMMGLSGVGDLMLTCYSTQSRNYRFGLALGQGQAAQNAIAAIGSTIEGIKTAQAAAELAARHGIEVPIIGATAGILSGGHSVVAAIQSLLSRPFKAEGV